MDENCLPIGVFDSGIGGLTVVSRIIERVPNEKIIYFGDTARVPYGPRPPEEITRFSFEAADFLVSKNVKAIVVACNTIDATCLKELKERLPVPVFGILGSTANSPALRDMKKIGVIATERTIQSGKHIQLLREKLPRAEVLVRPCPLFVPLVENGVLDGADVRSAVSQYLTEFKEFGAEALILGCTHFPLLHGAISGFFGTKTILIDPAVNLAEAVERYLDINGIRNSTQTQAEPVFYLSGMSDGFGAVSRLALGREFEPIVLPW